MNIKKDMSIRRILAIVFALVAAFAFMFVFMSFQYLLSQLNAAEEKCVDRKSADIREKHIPTPDQSITMMVGPENQGMSPMDCDFTNTPGHITSVNLYIQDSLKLEGDLNPPVVDIDQHLTMRVNGKHVINSLLINSLPSGTNIDLSDVCEHLAPVRACDSVSIELLSEDDAYRSIVFNVGIVNKMN
jgi:hypothetical protein